MYKCISFYSSFILPLFFANYDASPVMSVDLGSESMKIAVIKAGCQNCQRGKSFDIALNSESKRTTFTGIAFVDNKRYFGSDALKQVPMQPTMVYQEFISLIGGHLTHPSVIQYMSRYPYHDIKYNTTTGQLYFTHPHGEIFTIEELTAMLLEHARSIAENHVGTSIKDCVITVPHYLTQPGRRTVLQAAKMARLNVHQLINANTGVALNFGVIRPNLFTEANQNYLIFNMGSLTTQVCIASYKTGKHHEAPSNENVQIITIKGVGYDPVLGVSNFAIRLRDRFVKAFNDKHKVDVSKDARAMQLLAHEAMRVVKILGTSAKVTAQVESLFDDHDFSLQVTRSEFEEMSVDLVQRIEQPFLNAVKMSNISLEDIQDVVLMGGGSRIPMVRQLLTELRKKDELGKGVNSDEAAALGAVYQAALYSPNYRVRKIYIRDCNIYPIGVEFDRVPVDPSTDSSSDGGETKQISVLFARANPYPRKVSITFNRHSSDFQFFVNYVSVEPDELVHLGTTNISKVNTDGVSASVDRNQKTAELRGIKAHFSLDKNGLLELGRIDCMFKSKAPDESTFEKISNVISSFVDGDSGKKTENASANSNETSADITKPEVQNQTNTTTVRKAPKQFAESVDFSFTHLDAPAQTDQFFAESSALLHRLNQLDLEHKQMESAVNGLETLILTIREKLDESDFVAHASKQEIDNLDKLSQQYSDWYEEQTPSTPRQEYDLRTNELTTIFELIEFRLKEASQRPAEIEKLTSVISDAKAFSDSVPEVSVSLKKLSQSLNTDLARLRRPLKLSLNVSSATAANDSTDQNETVEDEKPAIQWTEVFTAGEIQSFKEDIASSKTWLTDSLASIKAAKLNDDPVILVSHVKEKREQLARRHAYLQGKLHTRQAEINRFAQLRDTLEQLAKNKTQQEAKSPDTTAPETADKPTASDTTSETQTEDQQDKPHDEF